MWKALELPERAKEIKFQGVFGEFVWKKCFQRQLITKYLRPILVFTWNSALREVFNFYFSREFSKINNIFFLAGILHTGVLFYEV